MKVSELVSLPPLRRFREVHVVAPDRAGNGADAGLRPVVH
jgi:hypothetical protein